MLSASQDFASVDKQARALAEQRVEGQSILAAVDAALTADAALLSAEERSSITMSQDSLRNSLAGTDHRAIKHAIEALNRATENFAAQRMDASIKKALTGQKIADLSS